MFVSIPSLDQTVSFTPSDRLPYVHLLDESNDLALNGESPYGACYFLIPPEVSSEIENRTAQIQQDIQEKEQLYQSVYSERNQLQRNLRLYLRPRGENNLEIQYENLDRQLDDIAREIGELQEVDVLAEVLPGNVGFYWSQTRRAYIQTLVTGVDQQYIRIQPNIHEVRKVSRNDVCTSNSNMILQSEIPSWGIYRPSAVVKGPSKMIKL